MTPLRAARLARGWTQVELARRTRRYASMGRPGLSLDAVRAIDSGRVRPRHPAQWALCSALGIPWEARREVFPS